MIQIFNNTPIWVWFILAFLLIKGIAAIKDQRVSLIKSLVVPFVFIVWGLEKVFAKFEFSFVIIIIYLIFILIGVSFSYYLYRNRKFYIKKGIMFQTGSYIPIIVMLSNFLVKYILTLSVSVSPKLYNDLFFNIVYGIICGFTVGLFFGNILRVIKEKRR